MIGKVLAGHYKITQALSSGGFGQTFLSEDTHIPGNPVCVVKQLKPLNMSPQGLALAQRLFEQEARILTQLGQECDQIPNLLAYFTEDEEFYLAQEYIEGKTLDKELLPGAQWTESKVVELLQGVLPILTFIHSKGVIHRDIKPANLIRRQRDGKLVLIDFGAIKAVQEQVTAEIDPTVATGTRIGTQGYAPTEQGRGKPRPNSDLYALGMVGIQALTGRSPSQLDEDSQTGEIVWEHLSSASSRLKAILSQMTRYHFKDRYQSASEALQAIQQLNQPAQTVAATDFIPTPIPTQAATEYTPIPVTKETEVIPPQPPQQIPVRPTPVPQPVTPSTSNGGNFAWLFGVLAAFGVVSVGGGILIASMQSKSSSSNPTTSPATTSPITQSALAKAKEAAATGNLGEAIELAKGATVTEAEEARSLVSQWNQDWQNQQAAFQEVKEAYNAGNWQRVVEVAYDPSRLPRNPYWDGQVDSMAVESKRKLEAAKKALSDKTTPNKKATNNPQPDSTSSQPVDNTAKIASLQRDLTNLWQQYRAKEAAMKQSCGIRASDCNLIAEEVNVLARAIGEKEDQIRALGGQPVGN